MAETASVGELFVKISGTSEGLIDAAKKGVEALAQMDASGGSLRRGILTTSQVVTSGIIAMLGALDVAVKKSVDKMEEMGKSAQQIGVAVEALSRLEFAAKKAGVSADALSQGIKLFAKNAGEIRSAIEAPDAFSLTMRNLQVELNAAGGKVRDTTSLLLDLADRFSRMPDGVQKTRMAIELFGRSGAEMIPFLNQGREKIQAFMDASDRMGATIDKKATDAALRFNNSIRAISSAFDSVVKKAVQDFLPTMEDMAARLTASVRSADNMSLAFTGVQTVLKVTAGTIEFVTSAFRVLLEHIGGATKVITAIIRGDFLGAWEAVRQTLAILPDLAIAQFNRLRDAFRDTAEEITSNGDAMEKGFVAKGKAISEGFKPIEKTAKQAAEEFTLLRRIVMDGLTLGPGNVPEVMARLEAAFKRGKITLEEFDTAATAALGWKRTEELNALDAVMTKVAASSQEKMAALERAVRSGAITFKQFGDTVRLVKEQEKQNMLDTASLAASTLTTMFKDNKAAAIGSAIINTAVGVTKELSLGPPWGFVQAGLIAAAGAAQVAAISSASQSGGGSTPSASGASAAAAASAAAPVQQAPEERTLRVQGGFSSRDFYSGDAVKGIIEEIERYVRDGGTVRFQ